MAETLLVRIDFSTFALSPHLKIAVGPEVFLTGSLATKAGAFMLGPFVFGSSRWRHAGVWEERASKNIEAFWEAILPPRAIALQIAGTRAAACRKGRISMRLFR